MSLRSFLEHAKQRLSLIGSSTNADARIRTTVHVCLGNEAADADSLVSTLCYAYLKHNLMSVPADTCSGSSSGDGSDVIFLPAAGISRADLTLRRDVQLALQKVDLSIDNLICFDEIVASFNYHPESTVHEQNMKLTLCDHNALAADLEPQYGPSVVEIIDHHVDRGYYPWIDNGSGDRSIAFSQGKPTAMSTCTLVAEAFLSNLISRNFLTEEVATLLMAVIAVDSSNLVNATDRDNNAVKTLQTLSPHPSTDLFNLLISAKLDPIFWNELNAIDALRLDYKMFQVKAKQGDETRRIGISSVLQPASVFLDKPNCCSNIFEVMKSQGLSCYAVGTFILDPEPSRDLALFSKSREHLLNLCSYMNTTGSDLELNLIDEKDISEVYVSDDKNDIEKLSLWMSVFRQGNVKASRKMVAPLLVNFEENR